MLSRKQKNACFDLFSFYYQLKSEEIGQIMKNFANQIFKNNVDLRNWLTEQRYVMLCYIQNNSNGNYKTTPINT